jgi:hypothetical protein
VADPITILAPVMTVIVAPKVFIPWCLFGREGSAVRTWWWHARRLGAEGMPVGLAVGVGVLRASRLEAMGDRPFVTVICGWSKLGRSLGWGAPVPQPGDATAIARLAQELPGQPGGRRDGKEEPGPLARVGVFEDLAQSAQRQVRAFGRSGTTVSGQLSPFVDGHMPLG